MIFRKHRRLLAGSQSFAARTWARPVESLEQRCLLSTSIGSGQTIPGTIKTVGQIDTYSFSAAAGNSFDISLSDATATSGLHPYVQVFNPSNTRVLNNFSYSTNTSIGGVYTVPAGAGGTFTVFVEDTNGTSTGAYDLELAVAPAAQAADSNGDGGAIASGQTKAGTLNRPGDLDTYTFSASAGNSFDISLGDSTAASGVHPYLQVFGPTGTRVVNQFSYSTNTSVSQTYTVPAAGTGKYTVVVQDTNGTGVGVGGYDLELAIAPATQAADSNGDGGVITSGQTKVGTINRLGDLDTFTFTTTANTSFDISLGDATPTSGMHPYLQVFSPTGTRVVNQFTYTTNTSVSQTYAVPATGAGTYTVVVQDTNGTGTGIGAYDLELDIAPAMQAADSDGDGGVLTSGTPKAGTVNRTGDLDVYTFGATVNDVFNISLGDANATSTMHPYLQVFNPLGVRIVNQFSYQTNTSVVQNNVKATLTGTYTVVVQDTNGNSTGGYLVEVAGTIHSPAPSITLTPPANQTATATIAKTISLGSFTGNNTTSPYTVDVKWGDGSADAIFTTTTPGTLPGKLHTYAKAGTDSVSIVVTDSKSHTSNKVSFTVTVSPALASIAGVVFNDANANSKFDATELGLGLWQVYIDANKDNKFDTGDTLATTDADGNWLFKNLPAGTYAIRVVQRAGTASTTPATGGLAVTVAAGQIVTNTLFGEKRIA